MFNGRTATRVTERAQMEYAWRFEQSHSSVPVRTNGYTQNPELLSGTDLWEQQPACCAC